MANEADFLELLVANERVGRWMDMLMDPFQRGRHKYAIAQLHQDLQRGSSYVEEATRMGVTQVLTKLLAQTSPGAEELQADENTMDAISRIIGVCSGPMACGGKVTSFSYDGVCVSIREGALGDGLGAKVWAVCHIMCRELVGHPEIFKGKAVLELGSGTGLVGLVAALAGAQQVALTDYEDQVVANLRTCMHMNTQQVRQEAQQQAALAAASQQQHQQPGGQHSLAAGIATAAGASGAQSHELDDFFGGSADGGSRTGDEQGIPDDADLFDDAESVDELELSTMLGRGSTAAAAAASGGSPSEANPASVAAVIAAQMTAWDAENMAVRLLNWQESADALAAVGSNLSTSVPPPQVAATAAGAEQQSSSSSSGPTPDRAPGIPLGQQYPVILANEVMYELAHAKLVAAAIKHRLAPGGRALLCCAVRDKKVFHTFRDSCRCWDLRYRALRVQPEAKDLGGIQGREQDYEGGFLLMAVDHAAAPAVDWHRDDFVEVL